MKIEIHKWWEVVLQFCYMVIHDNILLTSHTVSFGLKKLEEKFALYKSI